ncbi:MAG TPA: sigma-E factor negative regulatory protein [Burkholderiales bacterium]
MDGISALMDGELDGPQAQREIVHLKDDVESRERWDSFHVIGDAIRGEYPLSSGFSALLFKRLANEPTVLAPRRSTRQARRFTTYALSAAASLCAVAFVGWVALAPTVPAGVQAGLTPAASLAAGAASPQANPPLASVASDGHMNEYLLAHQGFSPSTAIQGLAPYIRSVSTMRGPEGR